MDIHESLKIREDDVKTERLAKWHMTAVWIESWMLRFYPTMQIMAVLQTLSQSRNVFTKLPAETTRLIAEFAGKDFGDVISLALSRSDWPITDMISKNQRLASKYDKLEVLRDEIVQANNDNLRKRLVKMSKKYGQILEEIIAIEEYITPEIAQKLLNLEWMVWYLYDDSYRKSFEQVLTLFTQKDQIMFYIFLVLTSSDRLSADGTKQRRKTLLSAPSQIQAILSRDPDTLATILVQPLKRV